MASHYFILSDEHGVVDLVAAAAASDVSPLDVLAVPAELAAAPACSQLLRDTLIELRP